MLPSHCRRPRHTLLVGLLLLLITGLWAGCSDDDDGADRTTSTTTASSTAPSTTEPGTEPTPKASAEEAVRAVLQAEQQGDHVASYRLLTAASRTGVGDLGDWADQRADVPVITGFTIEDGGSQDTVVAVVEHEPGLDSFVGLSPARERQTWTAAREGGGWLVESEPDSEYLLPPDSGVSPAVLNWATAVQTCDRTKAGSLQALPDLFGISEDAAKLCRSSGPISVGSVGPLEEGPDSADLVAQYSSNVLLWARVAEVSGPTPPFTVIAAPIGDRWQVLGVTD